MYPLIFAVVFGLGACAAVRRHPAYSGQFLLRSSVAVLLTIGAMIAVIVAAVNFITGRSPAVAGITMAVVVILGTLAMIFLVRAFTTPQAAKLTTTLPPTAKLVHVHRAKVYYWAKFFGGLFLLFALLSVVIPGDAKYAAYAFGSVALLVALILLPVMYITSREFDVALTALMCDPWLHWQYTPNQWQQWCSIRADRLQAVPSTFVFKRDWRRMIWPLAGIGGGLALFSPGSPLEKVLYLVSLCGLFGAIGLVAKIASLRAPGKMRGEYLKVAPDVYLGHDGIFADGVFTTWLGITVYLIAASIDERTPRSLLLRFEKVVPSPYGANQIIHIDRSVLIPDHSEDDVARLQRELIARCPKAQVRLA